MTVLVKHSKVSTIPDADNTDLVRPSDWNADHVVVGAAESGANTDITSLSGIIGGISTPDFVQYDTTVAATIGLGKERWNQTTGTLAFGIIDGTTEVNIGQQMYAQVVNAESVTITKGQAVYLYQATGNKASVKLAYNTGDATSAKTLGLAAQDIAAGATGFVTTVGVLDKLSTGAYNEGDTLYLGATAGSLTNVKPSAPNHLVYIGIVERANNGNGQIYVRVQNGYELDEIHDVQIVSPTTGQTIVYDGTTSLWKNSNAPTIVGGSINNTPIGATTASTGRFSSLTLTNALPIASGGTNGTATPTAGTVAYGTGTAYAFTAAGTAGQVLQSNGASPPSWVTSPAAGAGGSNTQIQFNNSGVLAGNSTYTMVSGVMRENNYNFVTQVDVGTNPNQIPLNQYLGNMAFQDQAGVNITGGTVAPTGNGNVNTNTALGFQTLNANTTGANNTAVGYASLFANTFGTANTAMGVDSLRSNTTASNNTAVGYQAVFSNSFGANNTAQGYQALYSNTTGNRNSAVGYQSLFSNTANNNTAFGYNAGRSNTTGTNNTFIGGETATLNAAGFANTTGGDNVAVGHGAFATNSIGVKNVSVGAVALSANTTGSNNTAIGYQALALNTTGNYNVAVGGHDASSYPALYSNTFGSSNTAIGSGALSRNTTASNNTAVGYQTAYSNTFGGSNTAIGRQALFSNTTGGNNTAVGYQAGYSNTTGAITAVGYLAGYGNTTGTGNTAMGRQAFQTNSTGTDNNAFGAEALLLNTTGYSNSAFGGATTFVAAALKNNTTGFNNSAFGNGALANNTTASNNVGFGYATLYYNSTGASNTAIGTQALQNNTTASNNTALGYQSIYSNTTGANNTAVGHRAGYGNASANANTIGTNNTYIGYQTVGSANNNTNEMVIGYTAVGLGSNTTVIGNSSTTRTKVFGTIETTGYTVATLPAAGTAGRRAFVTDATAPTFLGALTGGGTVTCPVFDNGTAWVAG